MLKRNFVIKWIKILVINLLVFITLIFIGECFVRIINPSYKLYKRTYPGEYENRIFSSKSLVVKWPKEDEFLGWVCNNSNRFLKFSNLSYNKLDIEYIINSEGFRSGSMLSENHDSNVTVLMLGDSFLFGVYLKENDVLSELLEKKINKNYKFINLGIPGFGIDQMYLSYVKYNKSINPQVIVVFYIDDDIYRVYEAYRFIEGMNKPSFDIESDKLVLRTKNNPSVYERFFQFSYLLNPFYKKFSRAQSVQLTNRIFESLTKLVVSNNQKLLIIRCPTDYQLLNEYNFNSLSLKDNFHESNVYYYELLEDLKEYSNSEILKMYFNNDGHLTPYGSNIVSELIFIKMKELGIISE